MAMVQAWQSEDTIDAATAPIDDDTWTSSGFVSTNFSSGVPQLWVSGHPNRWSQSTINILFPNSRWDNADARFFYYQGLRFRLDSGYGRVVETGMLTVGGSRDPVPLAGNPALDSRYPRNNQVYARDWGNTGLTAEPRSQNLWGWMIEREYRPGAFGDAFATTVGVTPYMGTLPHYVSPSTEEALGFSFPGGEKLYPSDFGVGSVRRFAVDRSNDRVYIGETGDTTEVQVFTFVTKAYLHSIFAANQVLNVLLDPNGFVWLVDELNRLTLYDYDGRLLGCWHQTGYPLRAADSSVVPHCIWTWDPYANRFLVLPLAAPFTAMRLRAFLPKTEDALMSVPIPRQVPRRHRPTTFFVRASGSGGEPLSTWRGVTSGAVVKHFVTDTEGDAMATYTPTVSGADDITFEVPE